MDYFAVATLPRDPTRKRDEARTFVTLKLRAMRVRLLAFWLHVSLSSHPIRIRHPRRLSGRARHWIRRECSMTAWLRCRLDVGMFSDEVAVTYPAASTMLAKSVFVPSECVRRERSIEGSKVSVVLKDGRRYAVLPKYGMTSCL